MAEELGVDVYDLDSTTFEREDLERGFEPDFCFYIQNEERIRGKDRINLEVDPLPDLVIEIDITSPSLDKLPIYARLGVPEVWRHDSRRTAILRLEGAGYAESDGSMVLPPLTSATPSRFTEVSKSMRRTAWLREVHEWMRAHA